ncbi:hypothetical protein DYB31_002240 [Aphanomyces astaci]|uniref:Uncharacterized protein n=1 Tax=Aphanomyces astaci TaxID=112090 RepID=A0A397EDI1_APHAT|nr:hypothetical protein DYB31_002240 [Aphanomyces astaci]
MHVKAHSPNATVRDDTSLHHFSPKRVSVATLGNTILGVVYLAFTLSAFFGPASYLTELSVIYATFKAEPVISSMGYFNGIFFAIHNASGITGNLISSLVLDLFQWLVLLNKTSRAYTFCCFM